MPQRRAVALPGHQAPAVGFDQPFEMLLACHERVQRSLRLLMRLIDRAEQRGVDAQVREACADVLRYFDIAAPLHHEDEECHVFPPVLAQADEALHAVVTGLKADHMATVPAWEALRAALRAWQVQAGGDHAPAPPVASVRALARAFADPYGEHIRLEEQVVYPAARALLSGAELARMGQAMRARRTAG